MPQLFPSRTALLLASSVAIALGLGSCATTAPTSETESSDVTDAEVAAAPEDALQVVTTILPITQFTNAVAGDRAEVVQLLPTNVGPHEYQAKPGDVQAIANADLLVKNGLEMEFFLDDTIQNAENADLVVIDSSEGIATLDMDEHGHDHEHDRSHDHDHDHAEGEGHDHAGHSHAHGEFDPHVWLDPKRAVQQVENIRDGLIAADPEGEAEYTANAEAFIAELEALDTEITETLAPFEGGTFVVFHDFASYFAESYGLQSETLVGIPEENPSPEDVKQVMDTVQAEGLKAIMTEPQAGKESFEAIASDLNIGVSVFDPLETGPAEAVQPDYYLTIMRQNADNLAASFEASDQAWLPLWVPQPAAVVPQRVGLRF